MRTTIVCGLLGSGKTTFILNSPWMAERGTVVLVNDFGQAGIDGEVIESSGVRTVELPSGCVCCTLRNDLAAGIGRILADLAPVHLVIEPSGIASPLPVLETLEGFDCGQVTVIGMIDAAEYLDYYEAEVYGPFFREQAGASDVLLLNKSDLVDSAHIERTEDALRRVNPYAPILRTVNARADLYSVQPGRTKPPAGRASSGHALHMDAFSVEIRAGVNHGMVLGLFESLSLGKLGNVVRAKALLNTDKGPHRFDLAFGRVDVTGHHEDVSRGRAVFIGTAMDSAGIGRALGQDQ